MNGQDTKAVAVLLAGGQGSRMENSLPKQFMQLAGRPLILHALEKFQENDRVTGIVVVYNARYSEQMKKILCKGHVDKICRMTPGGATRQESARKGLEHCPDGTEFVLIHDAARPLLSRELIGSVLDGAKDHGACVPVVDPSETIAYAGRQCIESIPHRGALKRIQTPQAFRYDVIVDAHQQALEQGISSATDDCGLVLEAGGRVDTVEGDASNIKITRDADLIIAHSLLNSGEIR